MCGVFGAFDCPKAAEMTYLGLHALQHRAQEFAGIVTSDGHNLFRHTGPGIVQDVFDERTLDRLHGRHAVGHIRYSTTHDNPKQDNTQPLMMDEVAVAHNGNLINARALRRRLAKQGRLKTSIDTEVILRLFVRSKQPDVAKRVFEAVKDCRGSYSLIILYNDTLIAVRDPWGNRPLVLGKRNNSWFVSSETVAFDNLGIETVREVEPGEILIITKRGLTSYYHDEKSLSKKPIPHPSALCIFCLLYFAHPSSTVFGTSVAEFRIRAGQTLCRLCPSPGTKVAGVPDSASFHADGYAEADPKAKRVVALLRSHYIGRTFIEGLQRLRVLKVTKKFSAVRQLIHGLILTLVDDSIVRLTTLPGVVKLLRRAGVAEIHGRISTPLIKYPCRYGIDTPTSGELIAARCSVQEICTRAGLDSLEFMPLEGLQSLVPNPEDYCLACMTGKYPI